MKKFCTIALICFALGLSAQEADSVMAVSSVDTVRAVGEALPQNEAALKYNEGVRALENEDFQAAIFLFSEALQIDPEYEKAYVNRGSAYMEAGDPSKAEADFKTAISKNDSLHAAHYGLARLYDGQGNQDAAFEAYNKAIHYEPNIANYYYYRGVIYFLREDYVNAQLDFTLAIRNDDKHVYAYNDRASCHLKLDHLQEAIADYEKCLKLDPNLALAHNNLASAKRKLGQLKDCILDYSQAMRLDPDNFVAINNRGYAYYELDELENAKADFEKAISVNPEYAFAHNNLASVFLKQENYIDAEKSLNKAISIDNSYAYAYLNRGIAREMLRNIDGACTDWKKAMELGVNNAEAYYENICE